MKILNNYKNNTKIFSSQNKLKNKTNNTNTKKIGSYWLSKSSPLMYNISFCARLNRTPENFQEFNAENMPIQIKKYLMEDFETRKNLHPTELQKEAYGWLELCNSIDDVLDIFVDKNSPENSIEQNFASLKSAANSKAKRGLLYNLRVITKNSKETLFKKEFSKHNKDDLSVYLLKKIYLEGKTLKEINDDFKNEAKEDVIALIDGEFTYADLSSLGIKFPNLAYWHSFQATRLDKEYTPIKRNANYYKNLETSINTNQQEKSTRTITQETRLKLSQSTTLWWALLSQEDRNEQIKKMLEGKALSESVPHESILSKFQGPIQTIAMNKVGFSERLALVFSEMFSDEEFMQENPDISQRMKAVMLEAWNGDSTFREKYSIAFKETLKLFEEAYNKDDDAKMLNKLLNQASEINIKVFENAKKRRASKLEQKRQMERQAAELRKTQSSSNYQQTEKSKEKIIDLNSYKDLIKYFKASEKNSLRFFMNEFQKTFFDFIINQRQLDFKTIQLLVAYNTNRLEELGIKTQEQKEKVFETIGNKVEEINGSFNLKYPLIAQTNDFILKKFLYEITKDPSIFAYERAHISKHINESKFENELKEQKSNLETEMKQLMRPIPDKEVRSFAAETFFPALKIYMQNGFPHYKDISTDTTKLLLNHLKMIHAKDNSEIRKSLKFLSNMNAAYKYIKNSNTPKEIKDILLENMAFHYLEWFLVTYEKQIKN